MRRGYIRYGAYGVNLGVAVSIWQAGIGETTDLQLSYWQDGGYPESCPLRLNAEELSFPGKRFLMVMGDVVITDRVLGISVDL